MTVISANQPQDLEAKQLRIQFFGVGVRSSLGIMLAGQKIHFDSAEESAETQKFMRVEDSAQTVILDLERASQKHSDLVFFVESGSNDSVSWSVESLHDTTNLQSEGVSLTSGESMKILSFSRSGEDWQITSLEERESGGAQSQSPNADIPSSIQDLEMMARGGGKKIQKFSNLKILIDMTISMKPRLKDKRITNLIGAIQAVGVTSGATSVTTDFGGVKVLQSDISEELEEIVGSNLQDQSLWNSSAVNIRKLLPESVESEKRKSKFFVITDGYFVIHENTLKEAEKNGHSIDVLIVGFDGIKVSMPASPSLRVVELDSGAGSGRDFLAQITE